MLTSYTKHFNKDECNLLANVLDCYIHNTDIDDESKEQLFSLMVEFDLATDLFQKPKIEHVNDKVIRLNFE